jgi:signal transduction histidine kinase
MQIRTRLTLQFLLLGGMIMVLASAAIYLSSSSFRKEDFNNRLRDRARSTARLLLNAYDIDAQRVLRMERENPANLNNEKIIIIDFKNDTLYSTDEDREIKITNDILERVRLYQKVSYRQGSYEVLGTLFTAKYDRYVVIAAATDTEGFLHLRKLKIILLVVCLVSLVLFFAAGWVFAGRALKPITDVIKQVEDISITSMNLRVSEGNGKDEIGRLAKTFNSMLERLATAFAMQKDFIANASHELRTPLTSINGQLEVLMMKQRSIEEYRTALDSVLDDIRSLIILSNRLLLIARTSAESPVNLNKKARIDEILWQAQEETERFNKEFHVNIIIDNSLTDFDQMTVPGDEYLLKVAVANIIENACKYSPDHTVEIRFEHSDSRIGIIFQDNGIGISAEDLGKILEPFYRGTNVHSIPGSGIGLPLVNQIIKIHNGQLTLTSRIGEGTRVAVILPTAR